MFVEEKQTLIDGIHLKWEFQCNWIIRYKIMMTFALFNQLEEQKSARKKCARK